MRKIQVGDLVKTTWADPYSDMPTAGVFGLVIGMSDENRNLSKEKIEYLIYTDNNRKLWFADIDLELLCGENE